MPNRTLHGEIARSESLSRVSRDAALTFVLLISVVDDHGRFDGRDRALLAALYPMRDDTRLEDLEGWLGELEREGLIHRYVVDARPYLLLPGWLKYQRRRESAPKWPDPPQNTTQRTDPAAPCGELRQGAGSGGEPRLARARSDSDSDSDSVSESVKNQTLSRAAARSPAAPAAWALEAAESLRESVRRRCRGAPVPESLITWARDLERIRAPTGAVQETMRWYVAEARDGDRYLPECRSGRAFREKYDKVLAARRRNDGSSATKASAAPRRYWKPQPREGGPENVVAAIRDAKAALRGAKTAGIDA